MSSPIYDSQEVIYSLLGAIRSITNTSIDLGYSTKNIQAILREIEIDDNEDALQEYHYMKELQGLYFDYKKLKSELDHLNNSFLKILSYANLYVDKNERIKIKDV